MKLSMIKFWVASCMLLPTIAYAAGEVAKPKADLLVTKSESKIGSVALDVSLLRSPGDGVGFNAFDAAQKQALTVTSSPAPVNLRVLVDTSALCHPLKIDQQATEILALVKRTFAGESLVSVVAFNSNGIEVYENQRSLRDWKGTTITCKVAALASSYEKALLTTFQKPNASLPNVVWVLSSGNVGLSKASATLLKEHEASLHISLHNPILEREIRPLVDQTASVVGRDQVHFSTVSPGSAALLPEQRFHLSLGVPATNASAQAMVQVTASRAGQPFASENVAVEMNSDPWRKFLARFAFFGGIAVLMALLGFAVVKTVRYYQARYCAQCERRLRFSHSCCLFCHAEDSAYLIGKFNWRDRRKFDRVDVVSLGSSETEIGTHRKSVVPLIAPSGKRRECLVKIVREGEAEYLMQDMGSSTTVKINGYPLRGHRYLASGDSIQIAGRELTFLAKRSVQNV